MLAFIGGTGICSIDDIAVVEELVVETPDSALSEQPRRWLETLKR